MEERKPLLKGSIIEYCGEHAEVIKDYGGNSLIVKQDDNSAMVWRWKCYGDECKVISLPNLTNSIT